LRKQRHIFNRAEASIASSLVLAQHAVNNSTAVATDVSYSLGTMLTQELLSASEKGALTVTSAFKHLREFIQHQF